MIHDDPKGGNDLCMGRVWMSYAWAQAYSDIAVLAQHTTFGSMKMELGRGKVQLDDVAWSGELHVDIEKGPW